MCAENVNLAQALIQMVGSELKAHMRVYSDKLIDKSTSFGNKTSYKCPDSPTPSSHAP